MTRYLLSTQALADLALESEGPLRDWMHREEVPSRAVWVSVMSFELLKTDVERLDGVQKQVWRGLFQKALLRLRDKTLPVSLAIALHSADLSALELHVEDQANGTMKRLDLSRQIVAATAMVENLVLVDNRRHYHAALEELGLSLLDPYA